MNPGENEVCVYIKAGRCRDGVHRTRTPSVMHATRPLYDPPHALTVLPPPPSPPPTWIQTAATNRFNCRSAFCNSEHHPQQRCLRAPTAGTVRARWRRASVKSRTPAAAIGRKNEHAGGEEAWVPRLRPERWCTCRIACGRPSGCRVGGVGGRRMDCVEYGADVFDLESC